MPFNNADKEARITGRNNAPGGEGGVDVDVQQRLGAPGFIGPLGQGERKHGICCGITGTWLFGVLNKAKEATDCVAFYPYFMNVLRFQGAILKDLGGTATKIHDNIDSLHRMFGGRPFKVTSKDTSLSNFGEALPHGENVWGAYLSAWHHAIGVCKAHGNWFIMDPNNGLFEYKKRPTFVDDAVSYLRKRRLKKSNENGSTVTTNSTLRLYVWEPR
jgi:hypothetical protein